MLGSDAFFTADDSRSSPANFRSITLSLRRDFPRGFREVISETELLRHNHVTSSGSECLECDFLMLVVSSVRSLGIGVRRCVPANKSAPDASSSPDSGGSCDLPSLLEPGRNVFELE